MKQTTGTPRQVITIEIEFSTEELTHIDTAAAAAKLTRDGFIRCATSEYVRQQPVDWPFSVGYTTALTEGRPPTVDDLIESVRMLDEASPRKRITLSEETSLKLRIAALNYGQSGEELAEQFINADQLLDDRMGVGESEAAYSWGKRPAEQRPEWALGGAAFASVLRTLKARAPKRIASLIVCRSSAS